MTYEGKYSRIQGKYFALCAVVGFVYVQLQYSDQGTHLEIEVFFDRSSRPRLRPKGLVNLLPFPLQTVYLRLNLRTIHHIPSFLFPQVVHLLRNFLVFLTRGES